MNSNHASGIHLVFTRIRCAVVLYLHAGRVTMEAYEYLGEELAKLYPANEKLSSKLQNVEHERLQAWNLTGGLGSMETLRQDQLQPSLLPAVMSTIDLQIDIELSSEDKFSKNPAFALVDFSREEYKVTCWLLDRLGSDGLAALCLHAVSRMELAFWLTFAAMHQISLEKKQVSTNLLTHEQLCTED